MVDPLHQYYVYHYLLSKMSDYVQCGTGIINLFITLLGLTKEYVLGKPNCQSTILKSSSSEVNTILLV